MPDDVYQGANPAGVWSDALKVARKKEPEALIWLLLHTNPPAELHDQITAFLLERLPTTRAKKLALPEVLAIRDLINLHIASGTTVEAAIRAVMKRGSQIEGRTIFLGLEAMRDVYYGRNSYEGTKPAAARSPSKRRTK